MAPWIGSSLRIQILFLIFLVLPWQSANAYSVSISGASSSAQDVKEPSKLLISAGWAMPVNCASTDGVGPCNSCTGATIASDNNVQVNAPCNEKSIYGDLPLTITVNSDSTTDLNELPIRAATKTDYSGSRIDGITETVASGKTYTFKATWSTLLSKLGVTIPCSTTNCSGKLTFYFGPVKEDKFVEHNTVEVTFSIIDVTNAATNAAAKGLAPACNSTSVPPAAPASTVVSEGLCYYVMFPGDEKAYVTDFINGWGDTPADPDTALPYTNLVMFYAEKGSQSTLAALQSIKNNSSKSLIGINATAGDPLSDYKISGLENSEDGSKSYCFVSAVMDQVGNIFYFLDVHSGNNLSSIDDTMRENMCVSPSEVVGVLSDKDCFIATVAFGSRNHPFLDVLREFRNKYLHPNSLGKKFIKFYYKNGPGYAKQIGEYPVIKSFVKVLLLPVIALAFLLVNPIWLVGFGCVGSVIFLYRRNRKRKV